MSHFRRLGRGDLTLGPLWREEHVEQVDIEGSKSGYLTICIHACMIPTLSP